MESPVDLIICFLSVSRVERLIPLLTNQYEGCWLVCFSQILGCLPRVQGDCLTLPYAYLSANTTTLIQMRIFEHKF